MKKMELVIFFSTGLEIPLALGDFARVGCKEKKSNRSPHMKGNTCNIKKKERKKKSELSRKAAMSLAMSILCKWIKKN